MIKHKLFLSFLFTWVGYCAFAQQDQQYSQYVFNQSFINPAYVGYRETINANLFYRNQWTGIEKSPKSLSLSVDGLFAKDKLGLGLQLSLDQIGAQRILSVYSSYAYRLQLSESDDSKLAFGLSIGVEQSSINGDLLTPIDEGDEYVPLGNHKQTYPEAKAGVFYSNRKFFVGFSALNLVGRYMFPNKIRLEGFPIPKSHFLLSAGLFFPIVENEIELKPSFMIKDDIDGPTSLDLNVLMYLSRKLWIGGGYRTAVKIYNKANLPKDRQSRTAIMGMTEFTLNNKFKLGYSYDHNLGSLAGYNGSTHEISLGFSIDAFRFSNSATPYF